MSIVEHGLVYRIEVALEQVQIEMTMTTPAWPRGRLITDNARQTFGAVLPQRVNVDIELVWERPRTPDLMPESAKTFVGSSRFARAWTADL